MEIRPIKTENDYFKSLQRIEELWGAKKDTPDGDEFDLMVTLVESYEMKHFPIDLKDGEIIVQRIENSRRDITCLTQNFNIKP